MPHRSYILDFLKSYKFLVTLGIIAFIVLRLLNPYKWWSLSMDETLQIWIKTLASSLFCSLVLLLNLTPLLLSLNLSRCSTSGVLLFSFPNSLELFFKYLNSLLSTSNWLSAIHEVLIMSFRHSEIHWSMQNSYI